MRDLTHPRDHYDDSIEEDMEVLSDADMIRDALVRCLRQNARLTRRVEDAIDWFQAEFPVEAFDDPIEWVRLMDEVGYRG